MADNIQQGGSRIAYDDISDVFYQRVKLSLGADGSATDIREINGKIRTSSMPYLYDIAEGNVTGHAAWSQMGFNADVGVTEEDLWTAGGAFVWPADEGIQMEVVSSSTDDDGSPVGTGVRTVTIYYLNGTGAPQTETVTLDGTTPVNTVATDIARVNAFRAATCGSGGKAAGNILLRNTAGSVTYGQIAIGYTRERNSNYTVPAGYSLYLTSFDVSVYGATKGVRFTIRSTYDHDGAAVKDFFIPLAEVVITNGSFVRALDMPVYLPASTRLKVSAVADATGATCAVSMRGWLETV